MNHAIAITYADDTFNKVFAQDLADNPLEALEQIFAQWNNGSNQECPAFINAKCRSLSVGDFVGIDGNWYRCAGIGWTSVPADVVANWLDALAEELSKQPLARTFVEAKLQKFKAARVIKDKFYPNEF